MSEAEEHIAALNQRLSALVAEPDAPLGEVRYLLRQGAQADCRYRGDDMFSDRMDCTLLHLTARNNRRDLTELLLSYGADIDGRDESGYTALHTAASRGNLAIMHSLLEAGISIDARGEHGNTVAHLAVQRSDMRPFELTLQMGGGAQTANARGKTPMNYARSQGCYDAADLTQRNVRPLPRLKLSRDSNGNVKDAQEPIEKRSLFIVDDDKKAPLDNPETWHVMWEHLDAPLTAEDLQKTDSQDRPWLTRAIECRQFGRVVEMLESQGQKLPASTWVDAMHKPTSALLALAEKEQLSELFLGKASADMNTSTLRVIHGVLPPEHQQKLPGINQLMAMRGQEERAAQKGAQRG